MRATFFRYTQLWLLPILLFAVLLTGCGNMTEPEIVELEVVDMYISTYDLSIFTRTSHTVTIRSVVLGTDNTEMVSPLRVSATNPAIASWKIDSDNSWSTSWNDMPAVLKEVTYVITGLGVSGRGKIIFESPYGDFQVLNLVVHQAPATIDIKVNGSDGPVTIRNGESYVATWTSTGATYCEQTDPISSGISLSGTSTIRPDESFFYPGVGRSVTWRIQCYHPSGFVVSDYVVVRTS